MKRRTIAAFATTAALAAVAIAAPAASAFNDAFGARSDRVTLDAVAEDARRAFARVDIDRSGAVDIEEFAAQAVIYAELARLNRLVAFDGDTTQHIPLGRDVPHTLNYGERIAIDAVARRQFHQQAENGALDETRFVTARLAMFERADRNRDDALSGRELGHYAELVAQHRGRML
jgi:hypothetical protein